MIDSTLALITQAASNSLFIFCFCNLIILMILMGSKPGGSNFEQESEVHQPVPIQTCTGENVKKGRKSMHSSDGSRRVIEVKEVSNVHEEAANDKEENSSSGSSSISSNDHEEEEEEDDELRRRVEEFIEKVNRGWKEELRRTSQVV